MSATITTTPGDFLELVEAAERTSGRDINAMFERAVDQRAWFAAFLERVDEIAAMTPADRIQTPSERVVREDRDR
jgi:hypothetical protein